MGEKFSANPVTGTGSLSVAIFTSPGRSGFGPQLSLSYDSGAGNGPFGWGWSLSIPSITRKTDKGLPTYRDAEESDVFILSGSEDFVPALKEVNSRWEHDVVARRIGSDDYVVHRYRPRIEGLFARIERWTRKRDGDTYWRSISRDNVTTLYGKTKESRIADPADPSRVFSWLICESYDDKGNAIIYGYVPEDSEGVDLSQANERNRNDKSRSANRYLKHIKYGNHTPREPDEALAQRTDWLFEVIFDYGEHDTDVPTPDDSGGWLCRHDPFSSYRAGFEVRTYRLCQRVLMFHHFPDEEEVGKDCLVRSTDFVYRDIRNNTEDLRKGHPTASFIASVTQSGYKRRPEGGYLKKSLPPLELEYSQATIQDEVQEIDPESLENLPYGLDGSRYQWIDVDGEGIPGILTEQADAWFYKRNISPVSFEREEGGGTTVARFAPIELLGDKPSLAEGNGRGQQLLDLAGDGSLDLVQFDDPVSGFYERTDDAGWDTFTPFSSLPRLNWNDPNLRFVDLTGDGHADVLLTEDEVFLAWYPSLAEAGFGHEERVRQSLNEEKGPRLVFADGTQSVYLADISGDGLTDLVRIRNGEVCYWPNLGYGRFGAKVTTENAPWFDAPELFDQRRIRLADIDGSGTTDIIYLGHNGVHLYFNQSGNGWSEEHTLGQFPHIDNLSSVTAIDLLGNGTACLVWSSSLPGDTRWPMRYVELMGGQKPHLLVKVANNLGAETHVRYAPSTRFSLADKLARKPWITRLPFPVHVVERVETHDRISRNRFVTRYAYHHGYFDGTEREFRGFGMVEQWDTEAFAALSASDAFPDATNVDEGSHVPPVLTRTWFHTGAYFEGSRISRLFENEYYQEEFDPSEDLADLAEAQRHAMLLDDTILPMGLSADEAREATRALKGSILRQEIYALDNTEEADRPYSVSERNYALKRLQPRGENRHTVFFAHPRETVDFHYERKLYDVVGHKLADPHVTHSMILDVDDFSNVLRSVAIGYGRRYDDPDPLLTSDDKEKQRRTLITYTENHFTNPILEKDAHRTPLLCETRNFELLKVKSASNQVGVTNLFRFEEMQGRVREAADGEHDLPYEDVEATGAVEDHAYRRLIEHVRTLYRRDDLTGALPLGQIQSLALAFESYRLAFTPGLLSRIYRRDLNGSQEELLPDPVDVLSDEGRYVRSKDHKALGRFPDEPEDNWWIPSGRVFYSPDTSDTPPKELAHAREHFFLPHRYRDPFHTDLINTESVVGYDAYDLLVQETYDALGNRITAGERNIDPTQPLVCHGQDYRVLQPALVMDANRNRSAVAFDVLGMTAGTAVMGKPEDKPQHGDSLDGFDPDLSVAAVIAHLRDPLVAPHAILRRATTRLVYDLFGYYRTKSQADPQPAVVYTLARETHDADLTPAHVTKIQHSFSYSDGFGREIQRKVQAEPGPIPTRDPATGRIIVVNGQPEMTPNKASVRWVGSGWTVLNNKSKPIRQYEPFFTGTHRFEFEVRIGVSSVLFYDPVGRVVGTLHPDHTWEKVIFDPWRQETWDVSDTVLVADPQNDPDVGDFFRRLPDTDYLPTWYAKRQEGALGPQEQDAARKAAIHANTPAVANFDSLGRTFLTIAHNKFKRSDTVPSDPPAEEFYLTRSLFDIEGDQREVIDAKGRVVMRYDYDMLSGRIHQASMEAGERWTLNDVAGKPIRAWDSRGHEFRTTYDQLRRPTESYLREGAEPERLVERTVYGETRPNPEASNLRVKAVQLFDQAGVVTTERYDFKGNPLRNQRQLAQEYKTTLDWSDTVPLEASTYTSCTRYDALDRPVELTTPDNSVIRPTYNEANLLDALETTLRGASVATPFITDVEYDAKGQRTLIAYGNDVRTTYQYDPLTFRLVRLLTWRKAPVFSDDRPQRPPVGLPGCYVQNLHYNYDPVGNITHIRDSAQQTIFFRNRCVEPSTEYTYDALYRLIESTGREHLGQIGGTPDPHSHSDATRAGLLHPGDGNTMGTYAERYVYDVVGNFLEMRHRGSDPANPGWTRTYAYDEPSLIEPSEQSNRLSQSTTNNGNPITEHYLYDAHGNMTRMAHLGGTHPDPNLVWDHKDQLHQTDLGGGGTAYYAYDAAGQRVRKVWEKSANLLEERIYLGGFEIYRRRQGTERLERETLHIMDGQQRIALVETRILDTSDNDPALRQLIRYQFGNHLGSSSLELSDKAQIISYEEYTPYGSTSYQTVHSQTETPKRYRYTGKERDEESGLYYYGSRYYAAWLGRWTACEPGGLRDGPNLFVYVGNNPINQLDQNGKWKISWTEVAIGAGIAVVGIAAVALTAGALAPVIVPATAALLGVSEATVVTGAVVVGTTVGAVGTANTASEVLTGKSSSTGEPLTDAERSRRLGALPVELAATALGVRGLRGGPPTIPRPPSLGMVDTGTGIRIPMLVPGEGTIPIPAAEIGVGSGAPAVGMAMASSGGGGGSGSTTPKPSPEEQADLRHRRSDVGRISRERAEMELREALESENLTPRQREIVDLIEAEYGREAIAEFRETGAFPEGTPIENSHPNSVQTDPELAMRPGDLIPRPMHRYGVHPGETRTPLNGEPLAPNYAGESGFLILDESGTPIGQSGVSQVDESALNMCVPWRR